MQGDSEWIDDSAIGDGDLELDPVADLEELLLSALLWAHPAAVQHAVEHVRGEDFHTPVHRELFEVIAAMAAEGAPTAAPMVAARLDRDGLLGGHAGERRRRVLLSAATAGADGASVGHYARAVVCAAYRRSFHEAGLAITEAAQSLPEADLFEHMLRLGRRQRAAAERLNAVRDAAL
ncbi:DnaB-like helicase N-terminal domain-containing protein [Rhodococcus sp. Q]|uniref:DnaB-like helicase N-terminal domain-containing protein n=1 Tax=Rhodococcus sp. Q TaxID=2502252 RepID=UPI0010F48992|nr:DnaB-like helicase N-terminal domain-containing protein [Rhodococcus sp. Q]